MLDAISQVNLNRITW